MKINELLSENTFREAATPREKLDARYKIYDIARRWRVKHGNMYFLDYSKVTPEDVKELAKLVKITGRKAHIMYSDSHFDLIYVGKLLDNAVQALRKQQAASGTMPEFTGRATTAQDMARQVAVQTNGSYHYQMPQRWTRGDGVRHTDPTDHIEYADQDAQSDAWEWIKSKGKQVHYKTGSNTMNTAVQIGKFVLEPRSQTTNAFSDQAKTTHLISVRSAAALKGPSRRVVDITDQQAAALSDIAATKNANAMQMIQAMMNVLKGEQDLKKVIDNSKKIDPQDKAKLDAIIAGAKNFKEPNQ